MAAVLTQHRSLQVTCHAQKPKRREVVVGIDLGTTNSAVAYSESGKPRCIPSTFDGDNLTPSVVSFQPDGDVLVGKAAQRLARVQPDTTYYSVKRLIGRPHADPVVQEEAARLAYKVASDEQGQVTLTCSSVDRGYLYPEEVSAQVLGQLLYDAEYYTGAEVKKAVISVPAYFNNKQREATTNAGKLAGLEVVRIIHEPVAAALAYGLNLQEDWTVLVFDLGGGTYDISLLEVGNGTVEVLSTGGDAHLGGDDWDAVIVEYLTSKYLSRANPPLDPSKDPKLRANLRALAEAAKKELSDVEEVVLRMPVGGRDGGPVELKLSRTQFEKLSEPLWQRARLPLDKACWAAGVDLNKLVMDLAEKRDELRQRGVPSWKTEMMTPEIRPRARSPLSRVLLVGGASRMPAVTTFIENMTGITPEHSAVNPDEAVAIGAAIQASILQGEVKDVMVMDPWQASLMRAMAKLKLQHDKAAREAVQEKFDMGSEDEDEDWEAAQQEQDILRQLDREHAAEAASVSEQQTAAAPNKRAVAKGAAGVKRPAAQRKRLRKPSQSPPQPES